MFFAALFAAVQRNYSEELNLHIDAGIVGLSISYALLVCLSDCGVHGLVFICTTIFSLITGN